MLVLLPVADNSYLLKTLGSTTENSDNWVDVSGVTTVDFQVRACSDAHILLNDDPNSIDTKDAAFSVKLGTSVYGNLMDVQVTAKDANGNLTMATYTTNHTLLCDAFVKYWLRWVGTSLEMGANQMYTDVIFKMDNSVIRPTVRTMHYAASSQSVHVEWLFSKLAGEFVILCLVCLLQMKLYIY